MSDPNPATELLLLLYDTYLATVYSHLVVGIVFGTYVVLYGTSLYILLRNNGMLRSFPRLFMLFITSVMFVLGLIALVLKTFLDFQQFTRLLSPSSSSLWSLRSTNIVTAVSATLARIIYILSDTVCAWRAAVLWNYERRIVGALALFILGTTAAAGSDLGLNLEPLFSSSHQSTQGESHGKLGERALIFVGPTLATNILSTSLIGIKVWKHRRVLMKYLSKSSIAIRTENVFAMLIESGFVYCWIWILYLISTFRVLPDPGFAVMDAVLLYVSGVYPTIIVIFVMLKKSPTYTITSRTASTHFSHPPLETRIPMSTMFTQQRSGPGQSRSDDSDITALNKAKQ